MHLFIYYKQCICLKALAVQSIFILGVHHIVKMFDFDLLIIPLGIAITVYIISSDINNMLFLGVHCNQLSNAVTLAKWK